MEPVTAALQAFAAFNNFLCTPAGQRLADANNAVIVTILEKLHVKIAPDPAK